MPLLCSSQHRFVGLARDGASELSGELAIKESEGVRLERAMLESLAVGVEPELDACSGDGLQFTKRLVAITTTEAVLTLHDDDIERAGVRRQVDHALALAQPTNVGSAHGIIDEDELIVQCAVTLIPSGHVGASVERRDGGTRSRTRPCDAEPTAGQELLSCLLRHRPDGGKHNRGKLTGSEHAKHHGDYPLDERQHTDKHPRRSRPASDELFNRPTDVAHYLKAVS